jgi:hypothetical protein
MCEFSATRGVPRVRSFTQVQILRLASLTPTDRAPRRLHLYHLDTLALDFFCNGFGTFWIGLIAPSSPKSQMCSVAPMKPARAP